MTPLTGLVWQACSLGYCSVLKNLIQKLTTRFYWLINKADAGGLTDPEAIEKTSLQRFTCFANIKKLQGFFKLTQNLVTFSGS
jgi:hypothetical protein